MECAAGSRCVLQQPAGSQHKCPDCRRHIHAICGIEISDPEETYNNRRCFSCEDKKKSVTTVTTVTAVTTATVTQSPPRQNQEEPLSPPKVPKKKSTKNVAQELSLQEIRSKMNLASVKQNTRAKATIYKHQLENERFILWLYFNNEYRGCLNNDFCDLLSNIYVSSSIPTHVRRKWEKEALSDDEKKKKEERYYSTVFLRPFIRESLGEGGLPPSRPTINPEKLDATVIGHYLCSKRKQDGSLLVSQGYKGMRSSLSHLYRIYGYKMDKNENEELSEIMKGVKRTATEARQAGEGNIEDGKREITFPLYCKFNQWCVEKGTAEAIFARAYAVVMWNLACRGDSTSKIRVKHLIWRSDCAGIPFAHMKEEQEGENRRKKVPRNCFANPLMWDADFQSATFEYLCTFPEILDGGPSARLFPGNEEGSARKRFRDEMIEIFKMHEAELKLLGYEISELGVHSWRKGAHSYMNSGSTAGPSAAATCIRGGHAIGGSRDFYVLHERAGDSYCGRILAGLPINSSNFAVSHPDFTAVSEGITVQELKVKEKKLEEAVLHQINELFGKDKLDNLTVLIPFLRVGLASHLHHVRKIEEVYPAASPIRVTTLFTSSAIRELKQYVKIKLPWEDGGYAYASGIPPHTIILNGQDEIKQLIRDIIPAIENFMDDRNMSGNLSETRMKQIVSTGQKSIREELQAIKNMILLSGVGKFGNGMGSDCQASNSGVHWTSPDQYGRWATKGLFRRVPPDWTFPVGPLLKCYIYWHHSFTATWERTQYNCTHPKSTVRILQYTATYSGRLCS